VVFIDPRRLLTAFLLITLVICFLAPPTYSAWKWPSSDEIQNLITELRLAFHINSFEASDSELRKFLRLENNRIFVKAELKQLSFGERIEQFLKTGSTRELASTGKETIKYLTESTVLGVLKWVARSSFSLSFLLETADLLSTIATGINLYLKFCEVLRAKEERFLLQEYFELRKAYDPEKSFTQIDEDFDPFVELVIRLRKGIYELQDVTTQDKARYATYLEFCYQSWRLVTEHRRREAIKSYILNRVGRSSPFTNSSTRRHFSTVILRLGTDIQGIDFTNDERLFAYGAGTNVYIYSVGTWRLIKTLRLNGQVQDLDFSPTGRWLAVGAGNKVHVYQTMGWNEISASPFTGDDSIRCVRFSPSERWLLYGTRWHDADIYVYEVGSWTKLVEFAASMDKNSLDFSRDNKFVCFTSYYKYRPQVRETGSWRRLVTLGGGYGEYDHNTYWYGINFSPNGRWVAYGFADCRKHTYTLFIHTTSGKWPLVSSFNWECKRCYAGAIDFSSDSLLIAHGGDDLRIFRVEPLTAQVTLGWIYRLSNSVPEHSVKFSARGTWLAYSDGEDVYLRKVSDIPQSICFENWCLPVSLPLWLIGLLSVVSLVIYLYQLAGG